MWTIIGGISVFGRLLVNYNTSIYLKYKVFHLQQSLYADVYYNVKICKCSNLQSHYTYFQVHQIASDIVPNLYNKQ